MRLAFHNERSMRNNLCQTNNVNAKTASVKPWGCTVTKRKLLPKSRLVEAKIYALLKMHPHGLTRNELQVEILTRDLVLSDKQVRSYKEFATFIFTESTPINMICPVVHKLIKKGRLKVVGVRPSTVTGVDNEVIALA